MLRKKGEKKPNKAEKKTKQKKAGKMRGSIELKIMLLVVLLVLSSVGSIAFLVSNMNSVVDISNDIINNQVVQEEKIANLSRQYSYINGKVLTHVMQTKAGTMDEIKAEIETAMVSMDEMLAEFAGYLADDDARKAPYDSAMAEYAKYKKTVESLLVTSKENKAQAQTSASTNLPIFNEKIEGYMN